MKKQAIFKGRQQNFTDSLRSWNGLLVILKNILGLTGPMGIKSLHSEPIGNNEDAKKFSRYISNWSIFKIQKPVEVHIYLLPELFIFIQICI
jgi:hypothetical protein